MFTLNKQISFLDITIKKNLKGLSFEVIENPNNWHYNTQRLMPPQWT